MVPFSFQSSDTDLVFEDHPYENVHTPLKNAHSINRRSISNDERDSDVEELMNIDDSDEHWLWGSVKRIRRSIDKLLGTEKPSEASETTERQPKSVKKPLSKQRKKILANNEKRKNKKAFKNGGKLKAIGSNKMVMRPKREEYDDLDDDEDDDDEILEQVSSGNSYIPEPYPEVEVSEKEDRLCKFFCFIIMYITTTIKVITSNKHKYRVNRTGPT